MNADSKRYPLHITISTLFIALTVVMGGLLSWQSYESTSEIMLESADELTLSMRDKIALDFAATYGALGAGLSQFRHSDIVSATTLQQRSASLPAMRSMLEADSSLFALGLGYADGDSVGFTSIDTSYVQQTMDVPAGAAYVLVYVNRGEDEEGVRTGHRYHIFYDENLDELLRVDSGATEYDPRTRPWYRQAKDKPSATRPYVFFESRIIGLTAMVNTPRPGVVVEFDISLEHLSHTISEFRHTPDTEVVLVSATGEVLAYADASRVMLNKVDGDADDPSLARLDQLGSPVLAELELVPGERKIDFEHDGRRWSGSQTVVARPGGEELYALIITPLDELLSDAISLRWQQLLTAFIILLIFVPLIWFISRRIAGPLQTLAAEAGAISRFDFDHTPLPPSVIREVDELDRTMELMKSTINRFIDLINSLAGEKNLDALLGHVTDETLRIIDADAMLLYLVDETDDSYRPHLLKTRDGVALDHSGLPQLQQRQISTIADSPDAQTRIAQLSVTDPVPDLAVLGDLPGLLGRQAVDFVPVRLVNRNGEIIGLMLYVFTGIPARVEPGNIDFVSALSGFAAVTVESRQLIRNQEELLNAFIELIAGAIDAKSPYTGGHCQRVPEITLMLARAACDSEDERFSAFALDEEQWEELRLAAWLHDCGKVTTPEYVVDKATKLETIYDRIHEIRMRFEVLKRDAQIECWRHIAEGADMAEQLKWLEQQHAELDEDFAFIAECNVGGEFMSDESLQRLADIAQRTWMRTIDDRLGISWEERSRKQGDGDRLPVEEALISDKPEHLFTRPENELLGDDNPWGFRVDTPQYKYNRGELYNLSIRRGTLTDEDRYIINGHMIETIKMLSALPFPKRFRDVPLIAGSHHETMDGKGYPKKLEMSGQPLTARMMVIADIFEALTASDRPYKKAKTLSESLRIMSFMRNDDHIDPDLFELFLRGGVSRQYAEKFLSPEQIDEVDIEACLARKK